jgi:AGZA family xanthine/uracil permease-like MFS transporter
MLGAVTVFIIDRAFEKAACFALAGGILTFFGFIHGADGIGIGQSPAVAISYLAVAGILLYCAKYAAFHPVAMDMHEAAAEAD